MELNPQFMTLQRPMLAAAMTAALVLTVAQPSHAATPEPAKAAVATAPAMEPAQQCLKDLSAFQGEMQKDGYWRGLAGYSYGYPMYGYEDDEGVNSPALTKDSAVGAVAYWRARPGYEVRTLLAATQILAQRGQQASCEVLLGETRDIYRRYATEMRSGNMSSVDFSSWRKAQLAAAVPVASHGVSYRPDQLIGTEVLSPNADALGSVNDVVLNPQTRKIAYLVIARGGLFGIDKKYVPVPWDNFKTTIGAKILVLETTKADMAKAPRVSEDQFSAKNGFDKESAHVDAYWSAHFPK
ncbi:PRC-barrel domain-containing protein [Alcaligenaceae bacterium]|nr:PRC-barrel domain-containing protein [Alcaligenaceae bacterium]